MKQQVPPLGNYTGTVNGKDNYLSHLSIYFLALYKKITAGKHGTRNNRLNRCNMESIDSKILSLVIFVLGTVLWYLLQQKDKRQGTQIHDLDVKHSTALRELDSKQATALRELDIKYQTLLRELDIKYHAQCELLFQKHDADALALQRVELELAANHYKKTDLDLRFGRLEDAFERSFNSMSMKFDALAEALTTHIRKEGGRP